MKHILMGLKAVFFGILVAVCFGVLVVAIGLIAVSCGDYVAMGVVIALVLYAIGLLHSRDGG